MRIFSMIVPTAAVSFMIGGCQSTNAAQSDSQPSMSSTGTSPSTNNSKEALASQTATLWVKGLSCPYCVNNIDRQIRAMPGVDSVNVDLPTGEVTVKLSATNPATEEQLVKAIDDSGFTLDSIEMPK
jgi:copper chaperone